MVNTSEAAAVASPEEGGRSLERIRGVEAQFRKAHEKDINSIPKLISVILPVNSLTSKAIHAVRRCLVLADGSESISEQRRQWVKLERHRYAAALVSIIKANTEEDAMNASVAAAALTHQDVWKAVCEEVMSGINPELHELLFTNFVPRFSDLRLIALQLIEKQRGTMELRLRGLSACQDAENEVAKTEVSKKQLKSAFVKAWLSVLRSDMKDALKRTVLQRIPNELIPVIPHPLALSDFLISCFESQDMSIAIAALRGVFVLVSKHGLEYALFYQRVYGLLSVDVFGHTEDSSGFMELVATFLLKGTMIPGNMLAAFVKRLARRALVWPSHHAVWCLRLALDVLQKHPSICYLVHRSVNIFEKPSGLTIEDGEDPFNDNEIDPQASRANESSLWELQVLKKHLNPTVSRLAMAFERDLRKRQAPPPGEISDYTGLEFSDIFQAEVHRKAKASPLAYNAPWSDPSAARLKKRMRSCVSWT